MLHRRVPRIFLSLMVGVPVVAAIPGDSMILAILGISFLIFIHEWGHFYACKLTGTRTETFSIGFGPRLFGWEKNREGARRFTVGRRQLDPADHAMDFRVAAIPLGGYVKMAGEMPGEATGGPGGEPAPDEFPAKSAWARTFIISAGVIMNFITAIVFYVIAIWGGKAFDAPAVGRVIPGGAAWTAGLEAGDRIHAVGGRKTPTFTDLRMEIAFADPDEDTTVVAERAGERLELTLRPVYDEERGILMSGISGVTAFTLPSGKEGGEPFSIGPFDAVTVAGVPARGGADAYARILAAIDAGIHPVRLERADGTGMDLEADPADTSKVGTAPGPKVGLAPFAQARVKAVRGAAAQLLAKDDVVRSVVVDGITRPITSRRAWNALAFAAKVTHLVVARGDHEERKPVDLQGPAIGTFLRSVALDMTPDNRVTPLPAGSLVPSPGAIWRYPSSPAQAAGIAPGARITRVGDRTISRFEQIPAALKDAKAGEPIAVTLAGSDGTERTVNLIPVELERVGGIPITEVTYKEHWRPEGFGDAVGQGLDRAVRETKGVFRTIGSLFAGTINFNKNIAGPVTLIAASKRFAEDSLLRLIWFLAYVSIMLAVLNILPIPVLDGGHLMFILIEKIKGKPLAENTVYNMQKVGFLLLLVLMFFAFKNDIVRLIN